MFITGFTVDIITFYTIIFLRDNRKYCNGRAPIKLLCCNPWISTPAYCILYVIKKTFHSITWRWSHCLYCLWMEFTVVLVTSFFFFLHRMSKNNVQLSTRRTAALCSAEEVNHYITSNGFVLKNLKRSPDNLQNRTSTTGGDEMENSQLNQIWAFQMLENVLFAARGTVPMPYKTLIRQARYCKQAVHKHFLCSKI